MTAKPSLSVVFAIVLLSARALSASPPDTQSAAAAIDAILARDWAKHQLQGNADADDHTWVRRVYLDIIGRIPTTREAEAYLTDKTADKRARLIDTLLGSEGHVHHAFNHWADVLRLLGNNPSGAAYAKYIKDSLRENKPYDKMVAGMIAAQGTPWENGAIGYYLRDQNMPLDNMAATVRVFLGTRVECAQCHNHPFDKWTQMQFYQMAAFTYGIQPSNYRGTLQEVSQKYNQRQNELRAELQKKDPQRPRRTKETGDAQWAAMEADYKSRKAAFETERDAMQKVQRAESRNFQDAMLEVRRNVRDTALQYDEKRRPRLPQDYKYEDAKPRTEVLPGTMFGHECALRPGETALQAYARWMTSKDNPRFTTVIVNRLWKRAFGMALIEPLDELMDTTTPMIPELQTHLEKLMHDLDFDMRAFYRVLFNTRAYQRQVSRQECAPGTVCHFTGPVLRRMSAEQMWDSFVTLINPDPDMPNDAVREQTEQQLLQAKKSVDAINSISPDAVMAGVKKAAALYKAQTAAITALQGPISDTIKKIQALEKQAKNASGDDLKRLRSEIETAQAELKTRRRQLGELSREAREVIATDVLIPAQKRLYEKVTGKPHTAAPGSPASAAPQNADPTMMMTSAAANEQVRIPGYDPVVLSPEEKKAAEARRHAAYDEEAIYFGIPEKERKSYRGSRDNVARTWLRAAEVGSPAPRGHYLREFGQSDRETIENANHEASVPQALAMMNGQLLPQITSKYSQLMLTVNKAPYPDEKVDAIYMTLLSRKPTAAERATWLAAQGAGLASIEDLVWSLLNTQQFIFVQ